MKVTAWIKTDAGLVAQTVKAFGDDYAGKADELVRADFNVFTDLETGKTIVIRTADVSMWALEPE